MDLLLAILVGIGLSAACGFRIFVPFLVVSVAANAGHLSISPEFEWIGSQTAVAAFLIATVLEISAYYVPLFDNFLDSITTPASFVAGSVLMAAMVSDLSPFLQWSLAVIAGGGTAVSVQSFTVLARISSTSMTAGLGNPIVSTIEAGGSTFLSILSIFVPVAAFIGVLTLIYLTYKKVILKIYRRYSFKSAGVKS